MAENDVYAKRRAVAVAKQSSGQLTPSSTAGKTVTNPNETSYSTSSTAYKASNGNVKTTTSSAKTSSTSTTKAGDTTIVNIKALGAGGNSAVSAGAKGTYDNTPKKKEPTQEEVAAAQAEYNRLMSIDLKRQQAAIEQQQKLAANSRVGMVNAGGTFLGGSTTTNVRGTTAAEQKLAELQRDYNLAEETQRYTKYEKQLSALSDKDREIIQTLANYSQNPNSTKNSEGVPITQSQAINLGRIVEKSGYTQDEVKELVDAQVRVNNKADYLSKQEKFAATARGEDTILGITGKGMASAASTFENLAAGTGYLSVLRQNIVNIGAEEKTPVDYYTSGMAHAAAANAARSEVSKIIIENAQAKNPDKENAGQILSFLYQTGMSMVDSGVIAASALIGIPPIVGTTLLGGAAASSTLMEAHERGLSDTQAILTATAAGVAETLFEKVGIESLLKNTLEAPLQGTIRQQIQQALKHTALQGLVEGSEEGFTSLANLITDSIINGKLSDFNQSVYSYMANDMDPDAAKRAAIKDVSKSIGLDVLGGFISGGVMAGVPNFARVASYDSAMNALAAQEFTPEGILRTAQSLNVQSEAVDKISKAVESGKTNKTTGKIDVDNAVMRQAVVDVAAASLKNNEGDVRAFVAQQLLESGETTVESTELVEAVVKGYMLGASFEQDGFTYEAASRLYGPSLSKAETALINKSDFGNDLLSLMMQLPIDLGNVNISAEVKSAGESIAAEKASAETAVSDNSTGETTVEANSGPASVVENELVSGIVGKIRAGEKVSMKKAANDILADADALAAVGVQTEGRTMPQIIKDIKAKLNEMAKAPAVQQAAETAPSEITLNGKSYDLNSFAELMREKGITDDEKIRELFNQALRASTMEGNNGTDTNVNPGQERVPDSGADGQNAGVAQAAGVRAEAGAEVSKRPQAGRPDPEVSPERQAEIDRIHGLNLATKTSKVGVSLDGKTVTEVDVNELTGDAYDEFVMRQKPELIERVSEVELHGGTVHFILGGIPAGTNAAGETVYGDGLTENGKDIWVQVDGAIPAEQLLGHEQLHFDLSNRLDREAVLGEVMDAMTDTFLNDVADRYDRPDGPYTPVLGEITSDTDLRGELMLDYLEELCCDLNGNFNRVGYDADVFSALRSQLFESIDAAKAKVSAERATANGMTKESISTVVDEHGKSMFSVATMKEDLDNYMQDLRDAGLVGEGKAMTETDLTNLYEGINKAMDYAEKHLTEIERLESYRGMTKDTRPFSPYKENSDPHYKMALDYSTLCRKRLLTQAITERLQAALGRAVTPQESVAIRNKIKALREQGKKLTVACALCYVEAARLKSPKVINEFLSNRTAALKNYYSLKNSRFKNDVYNKRSGDWKEAHGLDRTATKATIKAELGQKKLNEYNDFLKKIRENYWSWLEQADPETFAEQSAAIDKAESMDASEYLSAESLAKLSKSDPTIYDAFISKVRSATRSKAMETDVPYSRGDVNSVSDALIEQMNEESGFRHQSWSDFQAMHLLDTIAAVIELSTRGAKMHTYTKVPDMVRLLCDTGMMINMSLIPAGQTGLNEDGTLAFDDDEGMPYAEMLELRKQHPDTAGNIAIGISDEQIRALMASDLIDYIIPYHTSGLNADMRKRMGIRAWKDFTKTQNEEGGKGPALNEWFDEREAMLAVDGFEYMVEASKKYLALCAERGLTPKFKQFLIDNKDGSFSLDEENARNYWKLLVDRKMVNQVDKSVIIQKPVVPKFDTNTLLEILSNEVNSQEAIDSREAEDQIVKEILNGDGTLPKKELEQARIIRDASVRYAIENTMGRSKLSIATVRGYGEMAVVDDPRATTNVKTAESYLQAVSGNPEVFAKTIDGDTEVYLGEDLPGAYTWSADTRRTGYFNKQAKMQASTVLKDMIYLGENGRWRPNLKEKHAVDAANGWTKFDVKFAVPMTVAGVTKYKVFTGEALIRNDADGKSYLYDVVHVTHKETLPSDRVVLNRNDSNNTPAMRETTAPQDNNVSQNGVNVKPGKFSVGQVDSKGRELSKSQQEFFKDSKMRDDDGNLKAMYHGTNTPDFTVFDPAFSDDGISLFFTDNPHIADSYTTNQDHGDIIDPNNLPKSIKTVEQYNRTMESRGKDRRIIKVTDRVISNAEKELAEKQARGEYVYSDTLADLEAVKGKYVIYNGNGIYITHKASSTAEDILKDETTGYWATQNLGNKYEVYLNLKNPYVVDTAVKHTGDGFIKVSTGLSGSIKVELTIGEDDFTLNVDRIADLAAHVGDEIAQRVQKKYDREREREILYNMDTYNDTREKAEADVDKYGFMFDIRMNAPDMSYTEPGTWKNVKYGKNVEQVESQIHELTAELDGVWNRLGELYGNPEAGEEINNLQDREHTLAEKLETLRASYIGTTRDVAAWAKREGYDGVIFKNMLDIGGYSGRKVNAAATIAVAFNSAQVKDITNLNPTKNPDIRFSMSGQQNLDPELADLYNLLDTADKQFGNNFAGTLTSLMNQAKKVTTAPVQTGVERVSNMAKSQHYGKNIAAATGMTRGDWLNMLTYKAQTNKDSQNRASEILYYHDPKTGKRMFLRDVNPEAYNVLLDTLRGQDAWNAVSVDTAYMIWSELKADAIEDSSKRDDFIEWTKAIREKETAMGQGVQALNKWKNVSPAGELLHAWELISKNKKMTEAQKKALYDRILKHYGEIENISDENAMKDKIVELARERGTVNNIITKKKDSIVVRQAIRRALNTMNMRELRNLATASCMAMAADTRQVSPGEAMRTIQVLNMLSKPSTIGKNIVGNTSFYGIDFVSMNGAALLDLAVSGITGTRSVAAESMTLFNEASRKGFMRSAAEVLLDVNMDEDVNRYDLNEGRTFKQGGSLIERLLSAYERNMNFMLVTPDEFYKSAAKSTERRVQQLVNAGKIKTEDKKYAETMANGLALYRTFQDSSHISTAIQGMRDWLNAVVGFGDSGRKTKSGKVIHAFGAGDIVAPFTKVAGNLVSRGIEYSPFAIVQGVYDLCSVVYEAKAHPKTFDPKTQAKAVSEIARGLNGSAIATVFMLLVRAGLMKKADDEDDPNVKALNASEGLNSTQLNLDAFGRWISGESVDWRKGDVLLDVNSIEPLNILMSIGATINSWDETTEFRDKVWDIAGSLADASAELPVVQNILGAAEDLIRYNREPEEVIAEALLSTAVSSVVPNVVRGVAKGMDTKVRNTYGQEGVLGQAADQFKSSIPGLREKLPASLDNYGNEKEYRNKTAFGRMMNAVFNPLGINIYAQDDLSKQLEDLRKKTGESSFYPSKSAPTSLQLDKATREKMHLGEDTDRLKLTFEQRQLYQATYGNTVYKAMSDLVGSSLYKNASNAEKQEMLESCKDYATEIAKKAVLGKAYEEKAWVGMAKNAKSDYNITTSEFLIKRSEYSDGVLSNNKAPKTKAAVAMDIDIDRYAELAELTSVENADKDGSKRVNGEEIVAALDTTDLSRDQKAFYMAQWNKNYWTGKWANPYGKPSAEAQKILDEMYAEIGAADAD